MDFFRKRLGENLSNLAAASPKTPKRNVGFDFPKDDLDSDDMFPTKEEGDKNRTQVSPQGKASQKNSSKKVDPSSDESDEEIREWNKKLGKSKLDLDDLSPDNTPQIRSDSDDSIKKQRSLRKQKPKFSADSLSSEEEHEVSANEEFQTKDSKKSGKKTSNIKSHKMNTRKTDERKPRKKFTPSDYERPKPAKFKFPGFKSLFDTDPIIKNIKKQLPDSDSDDEDN